MCEKGKSFIVTPKYKNGSMITYIDESGEIKNGEIEGIDVYQSSDARDSNYQLEYVVMSEEDMDHEGGEAIRIPEHHVDCLPRIVEYKRR